MAWYGHVHTETTGEHVAKSVLVSHGTATKEQKERKDESTYRSASAQISNKCNMSESMG